MDALAKLKLLGPPTCFEPAEEVGARQPPARQDGAIRHCLPPQPPVTLDWLHQCSPQDVAAFTARFDYFRLVLEAHARRRPTNCWRRTCALQQQPGRSRSGQSSWWQPDGN